jgi:hypothetical protein
MRMGDRWPELDPVAVAGYGDAASATLELLRSSAERYEIGSDDHFARRGLDQALLASSKATTGSAPSRSSLMTTSASTTFATRC